MLFSNPKGINQAGALACPTLSHRPWSTQQSWISPWDSSSSCPFTPRLSCLWNPFPLQSSGWLPLLLWCWLPHYSSAPPQVIYPPIPFFPEAPQIPHALQATTCSSYLSLSETIHPVTSCLSRGPKVLFLHRNQRDPSEMLTVTPAMVSKAPCRKQPYC